MQCQYNVVRKQSGFTLIELLIVVAIVGVLASVAYPSYKDQVRKGYIADAQTDLSNTLLDMEQQYQENRTYQDPLVADTCAVDDYLSNYFSFSCASDSKTTFLWTATNVAGGMGGAGEFEYSIDQDGAKKTIIYKGDTLNATGWEH